MQNKKNVSSQKVEAQYPFLNLLTENRAMAQGASIGDRNTYTLYRAIQKLSTATHANQNNLFTIRNIPESIKDIPREKLLMMLRRLISDQLVAQIFRIEYTSKLNLIPCYIAVNNFDFPISIYTTSLYVSTSNIDLYLKELAIPNATLIRSALESDFQGKPVTAKTHPGFLIDPFEIVTPENFDFPPAPYLIDSSIKIMKDELIRLQKICEFPGYGYMPIKAKDAMERLNIAEEFLREELIDHYQKKSHTLKSIINQIFIEESVYQLDNFATDTTEFIGKLAKAIKTEAYKRPKTIETGRYKGALTIETIIAFSEKSVTYLKEKANEENIKKFRQIKELLFQSNADWHKIMLFIDDTEKIKMHSETWKMLVGDKSLVYIQWELAEKSIWVFVKQDIQKVYDAVLNLKEDKNFALTKESSWQALALREIIDSNQELFGELFEIPEFVGPYGDLLRKIYINYIPWYLSILLKFNINWFKDRSYLIAKANILKEQQNYSRRNEQNRLKQKVEQENTKKASIEYLKKITAVNSILSLLDNFYYVKKFAPSVSDLESSQQAAPGKDLMELLLTEKFQLVNISKESKNLTNTLVLYPKDMYWENRRVELKKLIEDLLNKNNIEPFLSQDQLTRFERLAQYIFRDIRLNASSEKNIVKEEAQEEPEQEENDDSVYERFEKALHQHDEKEKRLKQLNSTSNENEDNFASNENIKKKEVMGNIKEKLSSVQK